MSGGSYEYECFRVEEIYGDKMLDPELDEMMRDLVGLLHDLEWFVSGDIGEEKYRGSVRAFKRKWMGAGKDRNERLIRIIDEKVKHLRKELMTMIGEKG